MSENVRNISEDELQAGLELVKRDDADTSVEQKTVLEIKKES